MTVSERLAALGNAKAWYVEGPQFWEELDAVRLEVEAVAGELREQQLDSGFHGPATTMLGYGLRELAARLAPMKEGV